ncbi:hypothetical protein JB92DRAFT_3148399 [Gautieria morchelliformis]|nr:hypothetical protein JB92DRAFT_3148399 [Gautieria morchelliformis]
MAARLFPAKVNVTPQTRILFTSSSQFVSYDAAALHLISFDRSTMEMAETTIDFAGEEITDAASFDDSLFILSRTPSGSQWERKWRRRFDLSEDKWTSEHQLYGYTLRLYSLASARQVGPPLSVPLPAVHMRLRARGDKAIVMTIGPRCVASIFQAPVGGHDRWQTLHEELTWDPREIANQRGYENPNDEPAFSGEGEGDDAEEDADEDESPGDRYEYHDRHILDYTFLSDTLVLRLSESALDRGEAIFFLDAFDLNVSRVSSEADQDDLKFGRHLPRVLEVTICENWAYTGMTTAFISRDNMSISQSDIMSVMIYCSDTPRQFFLRASTLLSLISDASPRDRVSEAIIFSAEGPTPFTRYAESPGGLELSPVLSKHLALFPICDVDPASQHPSLAILRFLNFSDPHRPPTHIDVPLASLLEGAAGAPSDLGRAEDLSGFWPRFGVQWNGGDILTVSFVDVDAWPAEGEAKAWLVKMPASVLRKMDLS